MKKQINSLLSILIFFSIIFIACKKTDDDPAEIPVLSFNNIVVGSQNNAVGCFLSLRNGNIYSTNNVFDNQTMVDLVFWFNRDVGGAGSTATWLTSPAGTMTYYGAYHQEAFIFSQNGLDNWTTKNNTEIGHLDITSNNFEQIATVKQLSTSFNSDQRIFGNSISPKVNDILRFRTHNGKMAIMRVKSITGNAASTNGSIIVDIKTTP